ncbi:GPI inositol-deacylase [Orussus abietinus]|uniref:GPI inositol-deacylase n=1 Tax=Orussus abietinus TaxID=222816 RepID=UPI00062654CD|nr:GPI inositol-deacylase [Orussus abietinus]
MRVVLAYVGFLFISLLVLLLYIIGASRYLTDHEGNTCVMTYMFEYPQYVRIVLDDKIEEQFPRYGLYVYGEGSGTEKYRRMHFTGLPVLFIPGNAGSHEQVRSLASVSLRKSIKDRTPFHFDFFTVSLDKDYSALYGGVLMDQTIYVSHCIQKILELYKNETQSVTIIGHSMGGIVAKGAILFVPSMDPKLVNILIMLATSHEPSLVPDNALANYYYKVLILEHRLKAAGTTVISVGGGTSDILVTSVQAFDPSADLNVVSTSVPVVWKPVDHLCILWCKQLIISIVRSLFDCVNTTRRPARISMSPQHKLQAFSYHLSNRYAGKKQYPYQDKINFERGGLWVEDIRRQYTWTNKEITDTKNSVYLMVRLASMSFLTIETINIESKDWLFACTASSIERPLRTCTWGWNLTNRTRILPDLFHRDRKVVDLDLSTLPFNQLSHIIVRVTPTDLRKDVTVHIDHYNRFGRTRKLYSKMGFLGSLFGIKGVGVIKSTKGHLRYHMELIDVRCSVVIELEKSECSTPSRFYHAVVELMEPWNPGAMQVRFFTEQDNGPKTLKLQTIYGRENVTASLRVTLDPNCLYSFRVQEAGLVERIACAVRDRWPALYTTIIGLLLVVIGTRVDHCREGLLVAAVTATLCLTLGIGLESIVAFAALHTMAVGTCCCVIFFGSVAHNVAIRFLARVIAFSTTWSDWLLGGLHQLPLMTTVLVLSLIPATCGALAMIMSIFLYFLKLTRMYEDYLEELFIASLRHFHLLRPDKKGERNGKSDEVTTREKILNHLVLFLTTTIAAIPALPSVLVWAKNFSTNTRLITEDPILLASWVVLSGCSIMGLVKIPSKSSGRRPRILGFLIRGIGWSILILSAARNPAYYQPWIPPTVASIMCLVALDSLIPNIGDP